MSAPRETRQAALPRETSSFLDRRAQLSAARDSLGETRLLSVVGPGGVGKTRFAIRLAEMVRASFAGGQWYVDLTRVGVTGSVVDEVSQTLGVPRVSEDGFAEIAGFLGGRNGLLILDNCEHVVEQCAQLVSFLLSETPRMSVLTTSRAELRIVAERVFVLEPFETSAASAASTPPAQALFLERSASILPNPSDADRRTIAEICRRLDGLPLAIELAATRVNVLSLEQMLERLAEPLAFLTRAARDAPTRQQTLRAAIQWSYDLCTAEERWLWRRMSVFIGGWDLDAAEWSSRDVIGDTETLDLIQSLIEKSIVTRSLKGDGVRYGMLDTVRSFGVEVSTADELAAARSAHRDWCLDRLSALEADWYGRHQAHWLSFTFRELPNIRAALEFCLTEGDGASAARLAVWAWRIVWQANGRTGEWLQWLKRIADLDVPPTPEIAYATSLYGGWTRLLGDPEVGRVYRVRAQQLADRLNDPLTFALLADNRASSIADPQEAVVALAEALAAQGGHNTVQARSNLEERVCIAYDMAGQPAVANRMRESLIARSIRTGESYETSLLLLNGGIYAARRGEVEHATTMLRQSLSLAQNLDAHPAVARVEEALAFAAAEGGDFVRAATLLGVTVDEDPDYGALGSSIPGLRRLRSELDARVGAALGVRARQDAISVGEAMSWEEGIAYALGAELPRRRSQGRNETDRLTPRESQVASLVGQGLSDREIAERLVISRRTAEGHVASSLMKLGFNSRSQLAVWTAQRSGD